MSETCRLCGQPASVDWARPPALIHRVKCRRCGTFEAYAGTWSGFENLSVPPVDRHLLSALTRTAPVRQSGLVYLTDDHFAALLKGQMRERTFVEKRDALLDWIAFQSRQTWKPYGARVDLDPHQDYPVAYCHSLDHGDADEWNFISRPLERDGLVNHPENGKVRITDKGWELLETRPKAIGELGFVAMKFEGGEAVRDAIDAGIVRAGYKPLRIDADQYIGGIMDRIVANIRESRFVVADFTGNKGGVYYEAGVAFGLGTPVFTLCREDCVDGDKDIRVHFDVRHLNLLPYDGTNLSKLTGDLAARIVAVLGVGPLPRPAA